jgi:hypothetical protein
LKERRARTTATHKEVVRIDHVIHDARLGDLFGAELSLSVEVLQKEREGSISSIDGN